MDYEFDLFLEELNLISNQLEQFIQNNEIFLSNLNDIFMGLFLVIGFICGLISSIQVMKVWFQNV